MKTVAVFFGGQSTEHDVSIVTAISSVIKPLELSKKYKVVPIYIAKNGKWYSDEKLKVITTYQSGLIEDLIQNQKPVSIKIGGGIDIIKPTPIGKKNIVYKIDIAFPAMHGTHGEDGELMGIFEMAGVPYVGCSVQASAVSMDKVTSKQITEHEGIPNTPWVWLMSKEISKNSKDAMTEISNLKYPLFVKPAHLGSSIGITKVNKKDELLNALEVAAHYDDKVIVEQAVDNLIEVTLPVMGNQDPIAALLERPLLDSEDEFFDFTSKYMGHGKKQGKGKSGAQGYSQLPADLPKELYDKAIKVGKDSYKALGCEGIARVDMLIDSKTKNVYFNEVNPLPGSLYSHNWRASGITSIELVDQLINFAIDRHSRKQEKSVVFNTNFLKQTKI